MSTSPTVEPHAKVVAIDDDAGGITLNVASLNVVTDPKRGLLLYVHLSSTGGFGHFALRSWTNTLPNTKKPLVAATATQDPDAPAIWDANLFY